MKTAFQSSGNVFLTNLLFRLVEKDFLSSGKSSILFRALLKLLKLGGGKSCLWKLIFWLLELIFYHFLDTPSSESFFPSSGNAFFKRILQSVWWRLIFCPVEIVFSYLIFFSTSGNRY